ncbi:hypothetical protein [Planococcus lenghuensis]|uniref:Uncharacterized protein n=1 Tax=Planococcus lenghuensis TaxID=2213202 RepID=A0A1Q2KYK4_9BACL|nr:hypothetical protein [Planococcus lenghuensis]AQQ53290.1 hypothetical protein B0X71_09495 [Planococcus lenghuensis]
MAIWELIQDLFGSKHTVVHVTRQPGESLQAQQTLKKAAIPFRKEIEGMASGSLQVNTGYVAPITKLKVRERDVNKARSVLKELR